MCIARPVRVLKSDGQWVEVEDGHGGSHRTYAALISKKGIDVGDYLLVHGELAIHKITEDEAFKILDLIDTIN